jgi:uncharacterized protein (TIGR02145 family)
MIHGSENQTDNNVIEKYCYNNSAANCDTFGGLYQWNEAMEHGTTPGSQGICPPGWHIPTQEEFQILSIALGGDGNALKAVGQGGGGGAGTDTSGFSALLAGYRFGNGYFYVLGDDAFVWSSTEHFASDARYLYLGYYSNGIYLYYSNKFYGFSVRCVKD